jgi:hypothetical protein
MGNITANCNNCGEVKAIEHDCAENLKFCSNKCITAYVIRLEQRFNELKKKYRSENAKEKREEKKKIKVEKAEVKPDEKK